MSANRRTENPEAPTAFAAGYHQIHADVSLNYQMNRFSTGAPDMVAEMRAVAPKIRDYRGYVREFLGLSDQARQKGQTLKWAYYLRSAEFYMFPDDPRKQPARNEFVRLMKEHFRVNEEAHYIVPYSSEKLSPATDSKAQTASAGGEIAGATSSNSKTG